MNSNPQRAASVKHVAGVRVCLNRTMLIGELIVCESQRLAEVCKRTKSIEPLQRMEWILEDAMEQVYNQLVCVRYSLRRNHETMTDQNGGQGDE